MAVSGTPGFLVWHRLHASSSWLTSEEKLEQPASFWRSLGKRPYLHSSLLRLFFLVSTCTLPVCLHRVCAHCNWPASPKMGRCKVAKGQVKNWVKLMKRGVEATHDESCAGGGGRTGGGGGWEGAGAEGGLQVQQHKCMQGTDEQNHQRVEKRSELPLCCCFSLTHVAAGVTARRAGLELLLDFWLGLLTIIITSDVTLNGWSAAAGGWVDGGRRDIRHEQTTDHAVQPFGVFTGCLASFVVVVL